MTDELLMFRFFIFSILATLPLFAWADPPTPRFQSDLTDIGVEFGIYAVDGSDCKDCPGGFQFGGLPGDHPFYKIAHQELKSYLDATPQFTSQVRSQVAKMSKQAMAAASAKFPFEVKITTIIRTSFESPNWYVSFSGTAYYGTEQVATFYHSVPIKVPDRPECFFNHPYGPTGEKLPMLSGKCASKEILTPFRAVAKALAAQVAQHSNIKTGIVLPKNIKCKSINALDDGSQLDLDIFENIDGRFIVKGMIGNKVPGKHIYATIAPNVQAGGSGCRIRLDSEDPLFKINFNVDSPKFPARINEASYIDLGKRDLAPFKKRFEDQSDSPTNRKVWENQIEIDEKLKNLNCESSEAMKKTLEKLCQPNPTEQEGFQPRLFPSPGVRKGTS